MTLYVRVIAGNGPSRVAVDDLPSLLVDLADDHRGLFPWLACRGARCGACRVALTGALDAVEPPSPEEAATLAWLGARQGVRLGCQLCFRAAAKGELTLAPAP
jgi:ferredoxin